MPSEKFRVFRFFQNYSVVVNVSISIAFFFQFKLDSVYTVCPSNSALLVLPNFFVKFLPSPKNQKICDFIHSLFPNIGVTTRLNSHQDVLLQCCVMCEFYSWK